MGDILGRIDAIAFQPQLALHEVANARVSIGNEYNGFILHFVLSIPLFDAPSSGRENVTGILLVVDNIQQGSLAPDLRDEPRQLLAVEAVNLDIDVNDNIFELEFPSGTVVFDRIQERIYTIDD